MKTWWRIYSFDVSDYITDDSVLGAEVPVWSELMNEDAVHQKVWPRAAAMADRHWGEKLPVDLVAITQR